MSGDSGDGREWVRGHMEAMLAAGEAEARRDYVLAHPVLLSAEALGMIQDAGGDDPEWRAAVAYLDEARVYLWEHPGDYPPGHGPLEEVVGEYRAGALGLDDAVGRAGRLDCCGQLSHTYLRAVMRRWLDELEMDVSFALGAAEIALEAALAMPFPRLAADVKRAAAEGYVRLVHGALMRRPDGHAYGRALDIGRWAVEDARERDKTGLEGEYLHELGTLVLDAYAANLGPSPDYPDGVNAWLARADIPMPAAAGELARAREFLSRAVELRETGSSRGTTRKALLEAETYLAFAVGERPDPGRVRALAAEALADLRQPSDSRHLERVIALRETFG